MENVAEYIKYNPRTSPTIALISGKRLPKPPLPCFISRKFLIIVADADKIQQYIEKNKRKIKHSHISISARNQAVPLLDKLPLDARIEPGALIREKVVIGQKAVVMMGAVINIGAEIGDKTMIDMNAVIGANVKIGARCHIGAGAVIAGVIEPPSAKNCVIGDDVLIGANAVILEGITIGNRAVIGAGAVILQDVAEDEVWVGSKARYLKERQAVKKEKIAIDLELR